MATKTITVPMCDLEGCGRTLGVMSCPSCGHEYCMWHLGYIGTPYDVHVCRPCLDFKLGITPKENA